MALESREVYRGGSDGFTIYADVAPLVDGHLLVVPHEHHLAMSAVIAESTALGNRLREVCAAYYSTYRRMTILEHGCGSGRLATRDCVDHAHWHLLPFSGELFNTIEKDLHDVDPVIITSLDALATDYADADYILHGTQDQDGWQLNLFPLSAPLVFRQYTRSVVARYIAEERGDGTVPTEADWEWATHAGNEYLSKTLRSAGPMRTALRQPVR